MGEIFLANFTFMHNVKEYEVYSPTSYEIIDNVFLMSKQKLDKQIEVNFPGMNLGHRAPAIFA